MTKKEQYDIIHIRDYYPSKENPAASLWVYDIVKGLQKQDISCLIISPTPYIPKFIRNHNKYYLYSTPSNEIEDYEGTAVIRPLYFKIPNNHLLNINFCSLTHSIANAIPKNIKPQLIHAHFGQNGIATVDIKRKYGIPLVTSFYGYDSGRLGKKFEPHYKKLIQYGDIFLALSKDMKSDLITLGFPENKIIIHHLGIDLKKFKNLQTEKVNDIFTFLIVARFDESKGIQDVIKAFSEIRNENMCLRIVGDGIYKDKLGELVTHLKLDKYVSFINNFKSENPRAFVLKEMQNCDVFLLTSFLSKNKGKEGTPVVLMEASACAKPCIATWHAGNSEVVIDVQTGFLVKERDINSIAEKMITFYDNHDLIKKMGNKARNHISKNFNQDIQIEKLHSIYVKLLNHSKDKQ